MAASACGAPTSTPSAVAPTTAGILSIQVSTADNISTTIAPAQALQLKATATLADGTALDVTNSALWQSSNPAAATVTSAGRVFAALESAVDITASYQGKSGSVHVEIRRSCDTSTISPASYTFSAFEGLATVSVTTPFSDCRWTVTTDADWLGPRSYDPIASGSGSFSYSVVDNTLPAPRTGHVVVAFTDGTRRVLTVNQEQPVCSYVVTPAQRFFGANGGTGSFDLTVTPATCVWVARQTYDPYASVQITSVATGTGSARITYTVAPIASYNNPSILVAGPDQRTAPAGRHLITINAQ